MVTKPPVVVIFDVNIYVDIAGLVSNPFTWTEFEQIARDSTALGVPHPTDGRIDSLRAVAMAMTGLVTTDEPLEVWTSEHIDGLVINKVHEKILDRAGRPWSRDDAVDFHYDLVSALVFEKTGGGSAGAIIDPSGNPPLDHEDGCVVRTALESGDDIKSPRYCVTRDGDFREADDEIDPMVQVLYPSEFIDLMRMTRAPNFAAMLRRHE